MHNQQKAEDKEDIQPKETPPPPRHAVRSEKEDTMFPNDHQDTPDPVETQDINLDLEPESTNLAGVQPCVCPDVVLNPADYRAGSGTTCTKMTFYTHVADMRDYFENKISAYIVSEGASIIFNTVDRSVPRKFIDHSANFLQKVNPHAQDAEFKAHGYMAKKLSKSNATQKRFRLNFPMGMTVNNDNFNEGHEAQADCQLTINVTKTSETVERQGVDKSGCNQLLKTKQDTITGSFSVVVNGTYKTMNLAKDTRRSQHDEDCDNLFDSDDESDESDGSEGEE